MVPEQREYSAKLLSALASQARLHIVERLAQGPASVTQIAEATGLKQSMTSQHLAVLLNAGAVICTSDANHRIYSLRNVRIKYLLNFLEEFYTDHLERLRCIVANHVESEAIVETIMQD